jgi:HSP20 family molecular chaperone IbpA
MQVAKHTSTALFISIALLGICSGMIHQQKLIAPRFSKFEDLYKKQIDGLKEMFEKINDSLFGYKMHKFEGGNAVELASTPIGAFIFSDHGDKYQLAAQIPGVKPEDIRIELKNNFLTVKVEHSEEKADEKGSWTFSSHSSWMKSIRLDDQIRLEDISANLDNGDVLKIQIQKPKEKQEVKRVKIPIETSKSAE